MKRFFGFVVKEFYHISRDRRTLLILFGIPVIQILFFGFAITNELKNVRIAILDQSKDVVTDRITDKILSSGYFILEKNLQTNDQVWQTFKEGKVRAVVCFQPQFAKHLESDKKASVQIIADASDPNTANMITTYISAIVSSYSTELLNGQQIPYAISTQVRMFYNPDLKGIFMFVPGVMVLILMMVSTTLTSISITREKEMGTMEVLMVSPLNALSVIVGKVTPYLFLSLINCASIVLLSVYVFGMPIQGSIVLLFAEAALFIFAALAIGIYISTIANSQQSAMLISNLGLNLPTIMLSGYMFPVSSMPLPLRWLSNVVPARWFITIVKGIMLKGVGIEYLWKETLVLIFMAVFFTFLSVRNYKVRME